MEVDLIKKLSAYWEKHQGNSVDMQAKKGIDLLMEKGIALPKDFINFYMKLNGMSDEDENGFLFFKINKVLTLKEKFPVKRDALPENVVVFGDYLHSSWWYGFRIISNDDKYEIGLIPVPEIFNVISTSLSEFLNLYLEDSPRLYIS